jgi:acetyl esterase/lipase
MDGVLHLPAREVPPPLSISAQARAALVAGALRPSMSTPGADDVAGWRANIDAVNAFMDPFVAQISATPNIAVEVRRVGEIDVYVASRTDLTSAERRKAHLHVHGGAWIYGGGPRVVIPAVVNALHYGGVVFAADFRLPPQHPFPAPLADCLNVLRYVFDHYAPGAVLVSGDSSGANLAAGLMHMARDNGAPQPGALLLNTVPTDLTGAGDSLVTNRGIDVVLGNGVGAARELYLGGADPRHAYASPLFGDHSRGFPPTYIRTGTRDLLLSDSVRMHAVLRKSGVEAALYVGEAMPHGGFALLGPETPEDVDAREDTVRWLARYWPT